MTNFDERKDKFENKFAHDAELRFKAEARRNKILGLWAAGLLGRSGAEAEAYAREVIIADLKEAGDADVMAKLKADFAAAGIEQSEHQIRCHMDEMLVKAIEQIQNEG